MIKSLHIQNFQSHQDTFINFDAGFNVIKGLTDSGKSAVIRALGWVLYNRPAGSDFRSWFTKRGGETRVTLTFFDDNVVSRVRSSTLNQYEVNGEVFKALRTDVPDAVKSVTRVEDVNLQPQHKHYFLLDETPGNISKAFNKVADLEVMDKALFEINSRIRKINDKHELSVEEVARLNNELEELDFISEMDSECTDIEKIESIVNIADVELIGLDDIIYDIQQLSNRMDLLLPNSAIDDIRLLSDNSEILKIETDKILTLHGPVESARRYSQALKVIPKINIESFNSLQQAVDHVGVVNNDIYQLSESVNAVRENLKELKDIPDYFSILKEAEALTKNYVNLKLDMQFTRNLSDEIKSFIEIKKSLIEETAKVKLTEEEYSLYQKELGQCPLCGGEL